jgi:hypothetical protein
MRNGRSRDQLAREANEVRAQFLKTVEQLDQRRRNAGDLRVQLERHARTVAIVGAVALLATASAGLLVARKIAASPRRRRRNRWRLARQMWRHPERVLRADAPSPLNRLAFSVLKSLLGTVLSLSAQRVLASTPPPTRAT